MARLPLEGVRVLDLGQVISIPFCTQWMAWMGAEVILVESRRHLTSRITPPFAGGYEDVDASGSFNLLNGNKKSCTIDLQHPAGRDLLLRLVAISDVMVENFATGVIEKLGLGYDTVRKVQPSIIMLSLGAFGRTGPMRDAIGYHSAANLYSGVADVTGYQGGHPRLMGGVLPNPLSGAYAMFAILVALRHRQRTGEGQFIELAMYEAMLSLIPQAVIDYTLNGREPIRIGNRHPAKVPHGIFRCRGEDTWVAISVGCQKEWVALCRALGHPEWLTDPRFATITARRRHQDALEDAIASWTRERSAHEATETLQQAGVPAGPIFRPEDLLQDPQLRHRSFIVETEHPKAGRRLHPGVPWSLERTGTPDYRPAPLFGQHTRWVLTELLGLSEAVYQALEAEGALR